MKMLLSVCGAALLFTASAQAMLSDVRIRGAKYCTDQFSAQEQKHGIPKNLLAAVSNTESGRWNKSLGMVLPWPWTINAEGKGYYFDSKAEAVRKVKALQAQGMKSIDIGCMQINLKHHPKAFSSIEQAFDPRYNVAYAAKFLSNNYAEMQNWDKAVAAYHSRTPKYGNKYLARVQKSWDAILGKVRTARTALTSREPERRTSPSYRVVKVYDKGTKQFANLRNEKKPIPLGSKGKRFSLSMVERGGRPAANKAGAIRAVDRINTSSIKRIAINKPSAGNKSNIMQMRSVDASDALRQAASAASNRGGFVSHFGASSAKPTSTGTKPKFIFVD